MAALLRKNASANNQKPNNIGGNLLTPAIMRMFYVQLAVLFLMSLLLLIVSSTLAISALAGGLIAVVPNAYFAKWAFRYSGARSATHVAQSFYRGEAGKFVLTTLLFAGVFILLKPISVVILFLAYIFMMALNWILALRCLGGSNQPK